MLAFAFQFCERVQLDSIVYNELGDPRDLISDGAEDADEYDSLPRYAIDISEQGGGTLSQKLLTC